jgi:hypothetical protein
MSPRSFWIIALKITGIYLILQLISTVPVILNAVEVLIIQPGYQQSLSGWLFVIVYLSVLIGVFLLMLRITIVNPAWTIDKLKLEKGINEENLNFNMHRSSILKIVIMVIGGITLIECLPAICQNLYTCFQQSDQYGGFQKNPQYGYLIMNFIRTIFGLFLLTSSSFIINYIEAKRRKPMAEVSDNNIA